jgi:hypothetical protein
MQLAQLIESLQALLDEDRAQPEDLVLFAHQPNYPLQCGVEGPTVFVDEDGQEPLRIVYLAEGYSRWYEGRELSPYAPRAAWGDDED